MALSFRRRRRGFSGFGQGNLYRLSIWTGPSFVEQLAAKLEEAGVSVASVGTEHVHVDEYGSTASAAAWNVLSLLQRTHGTDFGLRPTAGLQREPGAMKGRFW